MDLQNETGYDQIIISIFQTIIKYIHNELFPFKVRGLKELNASGIANRVKRYIVPNAPHLIKYFGFPKDSIRFLPEPSEKLVLQNYVTVYRRRWNSAKKHVIPGWQEYIPVNQLRNMLTSSEICLNPEERKNIRRYLESLSGKK